jgi:hypothetical protein
MVVPPGEGPGEGLMVKVLAFIQVVVGRSLLKYRGKTMRSGLIPHLWVYTVYMIREGKALLK